MKRHHTLLQAVVVTAAVAIGHPNSAGAAEPIRIGEINAYTALAEFAGPYRNGFDLAIDEVNAAGGVLGRKIEVIHRDDAGEPGSAVRVATDLVTRDHVDLLAGTLFSHVALAVSDFAKHRKVLFIAGEPMTDDLVWAKGNRYTFRLRAGQYMQADMLAEAAAKLPAKRWVTVSHDFKYGHDAVENFAKLLKARRKDVEFVAEQWPALGKIDAGSTVAALAAKDPDAIYSGLFGSDLTKFVREAELRGLLSKTAGVGLLAGEPEYIDPLGDEAPAGWLVTGYPWYSIDTPAHKKFLDAYMSKFNHSPHMGSLIGYTLAKSIVAVLQRAGSTDTEKMVDAAEGVTFDAPVGPVTFRAIDHQSTMGAYVGHLSIKDGKPVMVDWYYADGSNYLPSDEEVRSMRPSN